MSNWRDWLPMYTGYVVFGSFSLVFGVLPIFV